MSAIRIRAVGPTSTRRFSSVRAAARSLSGTGDSTERTRSAIRRRLSTGGGYIGSVLVKSVR